MKKLGLLLLPILAITLMLGSNAFAQNVGDNSVYFVTYYSNANTSGAPDGTLRIINDGDYAELQPQRAWNTEPCGRRSTCSMTARRCGRAAPA